MWNKGNIKINGTTYTYEVKHYKDGSEYGINGGRISKLQIKNLDRKTIVNYDRGWDVEPSTADAQKALAKLVKKFN